MHLPASESRQAGQAPPLPDLTVLQEQAIDLARSFMATNAVSDDQRRLLSAALEGVLEERTGDTGTVLPLAVIHLPALVYACYRHDHERSVPLCAAFLLLYAGLDLQDAVMDGDPLPRLVRRRDQALLAGGTFLAAVPQALLLRFYEGPSLSRRLSTEVARGLLAVLGGQAFDAQPARVRTPQEVLDSLEHKTGAMLGGFARAAAVVAGRRGRALDHWDRFGRSWGVATEIVAQVNDIRSAQSKDFHAGTWSVPVAFFAQLLSADDRKAFVRRYRSPARTGLREQLVAEMDRLGVWRRAAVLVTWYCDTAEDALAAAAGAGPARTALAEIVSAIHVPPMD